MTNPTNGTRFELEIRPRLPERIERLAELADDMLFSWLSDIRRLFAQIDADLWNGCGRHPRLFLHRVSQKQLDRAAEDRGFLMNYESVLSAVDTYRKAPRTSFEGLDPETDLIAYFCMEYGFHESLHLYSGGLGILAGDHCKAASDLGIPFCAIGLLFHEGYFDQLIDGEGHQVVSYPRANFPDQPVVPLLDEDGNEVKVKVELPRRSVTIKIWQLRAGRAELLLLDTDLPENSAADRRITNRLYGGDAEMRIQQELVLGVGGVRALRAAGKNPTAWHINEGHSAFQIIERCRERMEEGLDFDTAIEVVAASTVFTTHTPVPAGHDVFTSQQIGKYLEVLSADTGIPTSRLTELGQNASGGGGMNMTALALRGSRRFNGVSRIHGKTASEMESFMWPQVPPEENPIGYITNGVHVHTFLAGEWKALFDSTYGEDWRSHLTDAPYWESKIGSLTDQQYWTVRQAIKRRLLRVVRTSAVRRFERIGRTQSEIARLTRLLDPDNTDVLTLGFARRFTGYKRADLLFTRPKRLARLLNDPDRPVVVLFAGKAHPNDEPGHQIMQRIHELSGKPEFEGKVIVLEGYSLGLARILTSGVDVWLNTPRFPLEASGTSGQKAALNGVLNLSAKDGWWPEAFNGDNGWAISNHVRLDGEERDRADAKELLYLLEDKVVPLYYERSSQGFSPGWVQVSKNAMQTILPHFNSSRMVIDYVEQRYVPAIRHAKELKADNCAAARELATWKKRVAAEWPRVSVRALEVAPSTNDLGDSVELSVACRLGDLEPDDVRVECLFEKRVPGSADADPEDGRFELRANGETDSGEVVFKLTMELPDSGLFDYRVRIFPYHPKLGHSFEMGLMLWL